MDCPFCGSSQLQVVNSRPTAKNSQIWRRRKCTSCNEQFTTYEKIDLSYLKVIKRSGKVRVFDRAKLFSGIYHSSIEGKNKDRGDMGKLSESITQEVEKELILLKKKKIKTTTITCIVLGVLKRKSPETFLRFLSYREGSNEKVIKEYIKKYFK